MKNFYAIFNKRLTHASSSGSSSNMKEIKGRKMTTTVRDKGSGRGRGRDSERARQSKIERESVKKKREN